jgi:hypothetical protein
MAWGKIIIGDSRKMMELMDNEVDLIITILRLNQD